MFGWELYTRVSLWCVCGCSTPKEMLKKIAELDYSQSQLRGINAELRRWLDAADDEAATLRSENASLRKQVTM